MGYSQIVANYKQMLMHFVYQVNIFLIHKNIMRITGDTQRYLAQHSPFPGMPDPKEKSEHPPVPSVVRSRRNVLAEVSSIDPPLTILLTMATFRSKRATSSTCYSAFRHLTL